MRFDIKCPQHSLQYRRQGRKKDFTNKRATRSAWNVLESQSENWLRAAAAKVLGTPRLHAHAKKASINARHAKRGEPSGRESERERENDIRAKPANRQYRTTSARAYAKFKRAPSRAARPLCAGANLSNRNWKPDGIYSSKHGARVTTFAYTCWCRAMALATAKLPPVLELFNRLHGRFSGFSGPPQWRRIAAD